jgi:lipopolysaccharide export system protein LptA
MTRSIEVIVSGLLAMGGLQAAEITASRMAILTSEQGKVTVFEDGVTIVDDGTRISAGRVEFYDQQNLAVIHGGPIDIVTPSATVRAESAQYLMGARRLQLYRNVSIRRAGLLITGPSFVMDQASDRLTADAAIVVTDAEKGIEVTGGDAGFDLATEQGVIRSSPRMRLTRGEGLTVTGEEMRIDRAGGLATVLRNVQALTGDAVLQCETLYYLLEQDSALAVGRPLVRQQENRVTGRRMAFRFDGEQLSRVDVRGDRDSPPRLQRRDDEIQGRAITIELAAGKLAAIAITGDSGQRPELKSGRNRASGDQVEFRFTEGEVDSVRLSGTSQGTYFTDDGDRIEAGGSGSVIRFRQGEAREVEISDVAEGRLFRNVVPAGGDR